MLTSDDGAAIPRTVFLVGTPRSGTTWLQLLLAQHPSVVTSQESHLFSAYLSHFSRRWDYEVEPDVARRRVGLSTVLSREEFVALCRGIAERVLRAIHATRPSATIVLEKSPNHALHWKQIREVLPEASFIVLYRDPRAVSASLMAASADWGAGWAPDNALDAGRYWHDYVAACLELEASGADVLRVRYEDIQANGPAELARVFDWLGLEIGGDECAGYIEATRLSRLASAEAPAEQAAPWRLATEPEGFYRSGRLRAWRDELSAADVRRIEWAGGDFMGQLGYEPTTDHGGRRPMGVAVRDALDRLARGLNWRAGRLLRRL